MKCARQTCGGPARLRKVFAAGTGIGWRSSRCNRLFVLPLGLVVDAALRVHGGVLASTPVLWIAVQVESDALDSNGDSLTERTCLLVRIKIRGLFCRYGRQNWDRTTYRMSILASEGIEPLFRLRRRAHLERPRALLTDLSIDLTCITDSPGGPMWPRASHHRHIQLRHAIHCLPISPTIALWPPVPLVR